MFDHGLYLDIDIDNYVVKQGAGSWSAVPANIQFLFLPCNVGGLAGWL
jgi:hypothetical protein